MIMTAVAQEAVQVAVENAAKEVATTAVTAAKTSALESVGTVIQSNRKLIMWVGIFAIGAGLAYYAYNEHQKKVASVSAAAEPEATEEAK